jgi:PilZ domain
MSLKERRSSIRKICALPLRIRVGTNGSNDQAGSIEPETMAANTAALGAECVGKALNLSERGVYFMCRENLKIGQPIEMYFTLPHELTGRAPEDVRCRAHVVHVDEDGQAGLRGIGASVERFEPVAAVRNWAN